MNPIIFVLSIAMLYGPVNGFVQQVGGVTFRVVDQTGGVLPHATPTLSGGVPCRPWTERLATLNLVEDTRSN